MNDSTAPMSVAKFAVRKFAEIPKIVGRGPKPGAGRPSIYPFQDLKEIGDGFPFPSALTKKVRGAVQAYRQNNRQFKFAIRELRDDSGKLTGESACILSKILTPDEVAKEIADREAAKAAEAEAAKQFAAQAGNAPVNAAAPVVAASVDDALDGLDL